MKSTFTEGQMGRIGDIAKRHGLWAMPTVVVCLDEACIQIGTWVFLAAGATGDDKDGLPCICIYLGSIMGQKARVVGEQEGDQVTIMLDIRARRKIAMILAHELKHVVDAQSCFWPYLEPFYPCGIPCNPEYEETTIGWWLSWVFKAAYYLHPFEIRARWYSFWRWRTYYRALYQVSYWEDRLAEKLDLRQAFSFDFHELDLEMSNGS